MRETPAPPGRGRAVPLVPVQPLIPGGTERRTDQLCRRGRAPGALPSECPYLAEHPVEALRLQHVLHGLLQALHREPHAAAAALTAAHPPRNGNPGGRCLPPPSAAAMEEAAGAASSPPPAEREREQEQEDEDEEALHVAKRRNVLCSEFAAITSSDAAVARRFLASSGWHMEVRPGPAGPRGCPAAAPPCQPPLCFRGR